LAWRRGGTKNVDRNKRRCVQMATMQVWAYREVPVDVDLTGYSVEAVDGPIGTVDEATAQAGQNYLVVDTGPWIFGKRVLLPAGIVEQIDTAGEMVIVNRSREEIRNAPEYDLERGQSEQYRGEVGAYYSARPARPENRPASRQQTSRQRPSKRSALSRSRGRGTTRSRTSDEPTKDELYEQAKRLGIDGRSKMNKAQLERAVAGGRGQAQSTQRDRSRSAKTSSRSRGGRGNANPVEVQAFLEGVSYPTRKGELVREAESSGASRTVRSTLERLPEERFKDPTEVSEAIGKLR
jgi:hypothetical protein